jgi:hypothetical protein
MKKWRERGKQIARSMNKLLQASANPRPTTTTTTNGDDDSLEKGAVAALALTLATHNITADRVVRIVSESLESIRHAKVGNAVVSQPDTQHRLRASDLAVRLLERARQIPSDRQEAAIAAPISIQVLVLPNRTTTSAKAVSDSQSADHGEKAMVIRDLQ